MKAVLTTIFIILVLIGIGAGVYLVRQRQILQQFAAPETVLTLNPSTTTPQISDPFTVSVDMETGNNLVIGAEIHLNFDPNILQVTQITNGSFFPGNSVITTSQFDNSFGTVDYIISLPPGGTPLQGQGDVVTISFDAVQDGASDITFDPSSYVVAAGADAGQDVLANTVPTTINVQAELPTPTTVPTATPAFGTPSPTPTVTPTPTTGIGGPPATNTPTRTPTPTTGGVGGPASTSTPTRTPTPTTSGSLTQGPTSTPGSAQLPAAGVATPTILLVSLGLIVLMAGVFLVLL